MDWHTATIQEAARLQEISAANDVLANSYGAVNSILYARKYGASIALHDGWLYERFCREGLTSFAFPHSAGGNRDTEKAIRLLEEEAKREGTALTFSNVTLKEKEVLCRMFPEARTEPLPGMADYIYLTENLALLPGKKYGRKRNHIHQFMKAHPDCTVTALGPDNLKDALSVEDGWLSDSSGNAGLEEERRIIASALEDFGTYARECGMTGAVAYEDGVPFAFCLASILSPSVTDVHFEKCLPSYAQDGGYALINQEFSKGVTTQYINREEDLGLEGLRKAKLSYFPHVVLEKFDVYC